MKRVVGHRAVRTRFLRALTDDRLHHAWLLHGPAGIGKARLASELAAAALCTRLDAAEGACGQCHACRMLAADAHPDCLRIKRIEGKRDVRIDQVREALAFLSLAAAEGGRRVVVLDDAAFMNPQAANALLKGLEEPAPGSLLILVCHHAEQLPATVRSRCLMQPCAPLCEDETRAVLASLGVDEAHLPFAVRLAGGRPGLVAALADARVAEAAMALDELCSEPLRADIAGLDAWSQAHATVLPPDLIARVAAQAALRALESSPLRGASRLRALESVESLLRWPVEMRRHTLRPAPSLLAALLGVRAAFRSGEDGARRGIA
ncbi:MAG: DNA polymerase III subunit delta' [Mariprofundaceae bacterium]